MRTDQIEPITSNHHLTISCFSKLEPVFRLASFFLFFVLICHTSFAQTFTMSGSIENDQGTAESDVTVTAKVGGAAGESNKTSASGRYKLELEYGKNYTIEITKPGFPKRFFVVDLSNVKEESLASGDDGATYRVTMIQSSPGSDASVLSAQPITTFSFNKKSGVMSKDESQEAASKKLEQDIKNKKEKAESGGGVNKQELEKQLKDKIKIGDLAMTAEDYEKAEKAFLDAVDFAGKNNLDDSEALSKLEKADAENRKRKDAAIKEKQENEAFFKLIEEAKKLDTKKEYNKALEKLNEAKALKSDHKELNDLLTKVNDAIKAKEAEEKLNADYQQAMADGNQLFDTKDFAEAIKKFEEAKNLKPGEKDPPLKITAAQTKLNELEKDAQKTAQFESLLQQANAAKDAEKYDDAIKKFEEAKLLLKDRAEPNEGIEFCKQKKKELEDLAKNAADEAKRNADYAAAIKKADDLFKTDKFKEAIKEYDIAAKLKENEEYPKTQIAAANDKIMELAGAEERKKQFEQLKKDGEKAFGLKQLTEAKDKFTQANSIMEGDAFVLGKLSEIEKLEQANAETQAKEEQYKGLMVQGETALSGESYQEAKTLFEQARDLKPTEKLPKDKLDLIEKKLKEQEADLAKKGQFDALVASATAKEGAKDLKGALEDFNKAFDLIKDTQVKTKIDQIQADLLNEANAAKRKAEYEAAISKADASRDAKDWQKAIDLYNEAKKVDGTQNYPDEQITIAEQEIAKLKGAQERLSIFTKLSADGEKNFKDKKYKEAEANWKDALNFADAESDSKKTQEKLDEVAKILDAIDGEARKEQEFAEAIEAAQNLEKDDKLQEALDKYKEALVIKPGAPIPTQKEKDLTATIDKRQKEAAQKALFEGFMTQGDELFLAGKFNEAIQKFEEAKPIFPDNKQPQTKIDEVKKKMDELANDVKEQAYQKILADAENMRIDGKLKEAINEYNKALKERPTDVVPQNKIKEIENELAEIARKEAELVEKRKQYAELMTQAAAEFDKKELKKALNLYTDAQQTLPEEAEEANKKIEQITNLLANEEAEKQAEQERLDQLKQIIDNGDLAFKQDKYSDALDLYEEAKVMAPENDIVLQKIKITQDRIADQEKSRFEKSLSDKLASADKAFADRDYDTALDLYNELLELKPDHKKATEQIALIERIKTPASDISELPDLGTPSFYSILEGEALLSQAERQKEYLRLKKLRDQLTAMDAKRLKDNSEETEATREAWKKAKKIQDDGEEDPSDRNLEQWIIEQIIRERLSEMSEKEMLENILAYKDLMNVQANLHLLSEQQVDGVKGNSKIPNMNEDEIKAYIKGMLSKGDGTSTKHLESLLQNEAFLHGMFNLHQNDADFTQALTELNNLFLHALFYDLQQTTPDQLLAKQAYLDNVLEHLNNYAADISDRNAKSYDKLTAHEAYTKSVLESTGELAKKDVAQSYDERQKMLESLRQLGDLMNDQKNEAIDKQQQFQNTVVKLQTNQVDVYTAEMLYNYLRLHQHDQEIKRIFNFDSKDFELWENDIKNAYAELKEINRLVLMENDRIAEDKQKNAYRNTKDINELIRDKSNKTEEDKTKQIETAKIVQDADRKSADKQSEDLEKAKKNAQANRALLDQLERKELNFNEATLNLLGEQFPEGVTEENFVLKDDDDIVVEVKTRRIVVVKGSGNVYMRYSNRHGVTYTKNGQAITEYQWIKETQNAKLPKYKAN